MYTKGEVIWAKIKGFPWWPGVIAKVVEDKSNPHSSVEILVNFIGENSHAQLALDKVAKFQDKYDDFAKMKKKKLLEAIEIANKILKGETTFEDESDKLKAEYNSMIEQKPKPKPNPNPNKVQIPKKTKNSKSDEKSSTHDMESVMGQYESDQSSSHDAETVAEFEKIQKKLKLNEKKENTRQNSSITSNSSEPEKSPATSQNTRVLPRKKDPMEEFRGVRDAKPVKVSNMDEFIEEQANSDVKKLEELNGKLLRQNSKQSVASNTTNTNSPNNAIIEPIKTNILTPSTLQNGNGAQLPLKKKEFEELLEFVIEKIANFGVPSVSGPILEARIDSVLSKTNPESLSLSEIIENDLGKNVYTLLILLEELTNSVPNSGTSIEFEVIKEKLINYIDVIKNKFVFEHVEKYDHFSTWLKNLEEKKNIESQKRKDDPKMSKNNSKMEEEVETIKTEEEVKENTSMLNFEDFRFENEKKKVLNDKNKMVTTSTVSKPYHSTLEVAKLTEKQKDVSNPNLRKKICVKMCKILQEKYHVEKDKAQILTMKIEATIRHSCPDMQAEYKDRVLVLLKALKFTLFNLQESGTDFDYKSLKDRVEEYQRKHVGTSLDGGFGDESPR